ncbi:MAG: hypothetical protein ACRDTX_06320 [Pseudonocardiaceae bacterium]
MAVAQWRWFPPGQARWQRRVALAILAADAALVTGLAADGSVVRHPGGWGYVVEALSAVMIYAAAAVGLTGSGRSSVATARAVGIRLGVITGGMWVAHLVIETFAGLRGWPNLAVTASSLLGGFALWGVGGAMTRRRTGSVPVSVLSAVCAAMVCVAFTITVGFTLAYLAQPRLEHNIDGSPEYLRSAWLDLHAFAIANTLDAGFTHALIAPLVAAITGTIGAVAARPAGRGEPR